MAVVAVAVAALAGWLALGPPAGRLGPGRPTRRPRPGAGLRWLRIAAPLLGLAVVITVVAVVAGPGAGAVTTAVGVAVLTAGLLAARHRRSTGVARRRREVARATSSLAVQLQAGLVATDALQNAAADWVVLSEGAAALRLGADPAAVWHDQSRRPGLGGLASLARGWQLCVRSGAPLAPTLRQIAESLEAEEALSLTVTGELSAPRATGRVMAALPVVGLGLGFAMGGDPVDFLVGSRPGRACLVSGAVLAAAGVLWIERIAGRIASRL